MSERKLDHFSNGSHLLSASSDIIITNIVKFFLILTVNWLTLRVEHSVRCNNTELLGLSCHNFELNWLEVPPDEEEIALLDGSVRVLEVRDQIGLGEITLDALDSVRQWKYVDFCEVGDVASRPNLDNVSETHSKILADGFIHSDLALIQLVIDERDNKSLFALLSLDENGVALEDLELTHLCRAELDGGVLVV